MNPQPLIEQPAKPATTQKASNPAPYDVIVVGARVAGAATAMLLARSGLRTLLLDRAPAAGFDTLSTHALMRAGVLQLHRWGLLDRLAAANTPAVCRTSIHYGDETQVVHLKARAGISSLYAPRRTLLDPILVDAAAAAGAEVRYGVTVKGLRWRGGRVVGVEARDRQGRMLEARAPLVVGADGARSVVARAVQAPTTWQGASASALIYGYWEGMPTESYEWFYRDGATAGIIPTNHGLACVWAATAAWRFQTEMRGDLEKAFRRLLLEAAPAAVEAVADRRRVERLRGFPGIPGYLRRPWGPGWALVGDAGSFRDPLTAHGMSDALRDAELLTRAVVVALGREGRGFDALADYERRRDEVALPIARHTDVVASYGWTIPSVKEQLLAFSKAMGREVEMIDGWDHGVEDDALEESVHEMSIAG